MRILGIDPGSVLTGAGIIDVRGDAAECVYYGGIKTSGDHFPQRLGQIFQGVQNLIQEYKPDQCAVETVFVNRNAMSALKLGQARGAAVVAATNLGLEVAEYEPRLIKQAIVGKGNADKVQVQHMVGVLLRLNRKLQADAADALAVALCHQHHYQTRQRLRKAGIGS